MIDPRIIRDNPEIIRQALQRRNYDFDLDRLIRVEANHRQKLNIVEKLREQKNSLSNSIGAAYKKGNTDEAEELKTSVIELKAQLQKEEVELGILEEEFNTLMLELPNIPRDEVPDGVDADDNVVMYTWYPK